MLTQTIGPNEGQMLKLLKYLFPEGGRIRLIPGEYFLDETIFIPSNTEIFSDEEGVKLTLLPGSNCHVFTNSQHQDGNQNIKLKGLEVHGNRTLQTRPENHKPLTFACGAYLKNCKGVTVTECSFFDINQNALHFNNSEEILLRNITTTRLGWSGLGTSGASAIRLENFNVYESGLETRHSGIHFDGGTGVYVQGEVCDSTGNGIMLDSAYGPLEHCEVDVVAKRCFRGLSLSGSGKHSLKSVLVKGTFDNNKKAGIMVSNAESVYFSDVKVRGNAEHGILFQGRNGGSNCLISTEAIIENNGKDIEELHQSKNNWDGRFLQNHSADDEMALGEVCSKTLSTTTRFRRV